MVITLQPSDAIFGYRKKRRGRGSREGQKGRGGKGGRAAGEMDRGRRERTWNRAAHWLRPVLRGHVIRNVHKWILSQCMIN